MNVFPHEPSEMYNRRFAGTNMDSIKVATHRVQYKIEVVSIVRFTSNLFSLRNYPFEELFRRFGYLPKAIIKNKRKRQRRQPRAYTPTTVQFQT